MSTAFAWKKLLQRCPLHWNRVAPWRAGHVALGAELPFAIGRMSGHIEYDAFKDAEHSSHIARAEWF
jgi:hypothetical protein